MTTFTLTLAGVPIGVQAIHPSTRTFCQDYLTDRQPAFSVAISQPDIDFEREKSAQEDELEGIPVRHFSDPYLETLALYRKIVVRLVDYGILLFHGSVVAVGQQAYLFTAKSGTGKTTHTRLWLKHIPGAYVVNGDKPLLKVTDTGVIACGTPWQGKENYGTHVNVPLKALVVLERDQTNHITRINLKEALPMLFQQCYRPTQSQQMIKTVQLLGKLGQAVKLYRLGCNMEAEAATVAYQGLTEPESEQS